VTDAAPFTPAALKSNNLAATRAQICRASPFNHVTNHSFNGSRMGSFRNFPVRVHLWLLISGINSGVHKTSKVGSSRIHPNSVFFRAEVYKKAQRHRVAERRALPISNLRSQICHPLRGVGSFGNFSPMLICTYVSVLSFHLTHLTDHSFNHLRRWLRFANSGLNHECIPRTRIGNGFVW
jgi:hypothetical protein